MSDTKISDKEYIANTYNRFDLEIVKGKGELVWDENGKESDWSRTAFFEAGLLTNSCWKGKWIFSPTEPTGLYNFKKV